MKKLNNILLCVILCITNPLYAARTLPGQTQIPTKPASQAAQKTVQKLIPQLPAQQKPIGQPQSYIQALTAIKTTMPPTMILRNNVFTQEFLNFIKSLNLSDIENTALLQAGANIHAVWTGNNEQDKQIALSFKNNIDLAAQHLASIPQISPEPTQVQITKQQPQITPTQQQKRKARIKQQKPSVTIPTTKITQPIKPIAPVSTEPALMGGNFPTNSAILILDPKKAETLERRVGAMVETAIRALYEQAAPIIMTSNVLEIIAAIIQRIGINNLQQLKNVPYNQLDTYTTQLLQLHNLNTVSVITLQLLSLILFDSNHFNCYLHNSADLVLLIPKQYITSNLPNAANLNGYEQAQACGFNPTVITMLNDLTPDTLVKQLQIQQSTPINEETFITKLISMFIPQKRNGELISPEQDTKWIMYIAGHGHPAHETIGTIRQQLSVHKNNLNMLQSGRVKQDQNYFIIKAQAEEYVPKYEKILEGKSNWPDSQLIPETAGISGLSADSFSRLITFFNNNLSMGYLHYMSCFAGGYNQTFVNEVLSSLSTNFIVSSEGIHEGSVKSSGINLQYSPQEPRIRLVNKSFTDFFKLLRLFIAQPEEFVKNKEKGKEPVAQILRTLTPNMQESNQPFVRFPGAGVFSALSLGKGTKKLTKTIVKAHEIENTAIDVSSPAINIVVVDASRINVPLIFKKNKDCAIVSPTPTTIIPNYEVINIFKEINFENTLQSLLYNFIHLNGRIHAQTFIVNTLTGILHKESGLPTQPGQNSISNLIIHMKGFAGRAQGMTSTSAIQTNFLSPENIQYSRIGVNVQIIFELNNNIYQCAMGIKDFDDNKTLQEYFRQITFIPQPAQTANMNDIANQFLTPQEIAKLQKPITLNSIAEFIDSKIDQPFSPEQSEALLEFTKRKPQ
jgi:hypothetical protein